MKMLNLTLQQTMQFLAALICNVNFLVNGFISTVKKQQEKKKENVPLAVLKSTRSKILPSFILYFHNYWDCFPLCFLQAFALVYLERFLQVSCWFLSAIFVQGTLG